MSKVFSFRLDDNNPREAQAREVIETWASEGYSLRQIITNALLQKSDKGNFSEDFDILIEGLRDLINQRENKPKPENIESGKAETLPPSFLEGIRKSVKLGIDSA